MAYKLQTLLSRRLNKNYLLRILAVKEVIKVKIRQKELSCFDLDKIKNLECKNKRGER
jgi:hypothetical protein